jgi:DNA-binding NtrC family response regulator
MRWLRAIARNGESMMKTHWHILVVDDEEVMRESLAAWLREDGYAVDTAVSGSNALQKARACDFAIYFIDLKMPGGMDGIETMMEIRKCHPDASIIIVTAYATVDTAITAMKEGAQEYIVKPCNPEEISLLVERIIKVKNLQRENIILRKKLTRQYSFQDIVSKSPRMLEIFTLIRDVASLRSTVLIQGESGTGKELIARAIHFSGDRATKPFIGVSCAALAETLLESELFGHERGSFTGAFEQKKGKFEIANGGTIFLDEIGDISPKLQLNLLRVLQERDFYRVGGSQQIQVDVRVIAATNRDLELAVREGRFRDDLYYRLNVIDIRIPPLRERREDIPLLANHFVERIAHELGKDVGSVSEGALALLMNHEWPGNVREFENALERAIVGAKSSVLGEEDFSFLNHKRGQEEWAPPRDMTLEQLENQAIVAMLHRTHGNIKEAASALGIDRSTLYEKIRKFNLPRY